MWGSHEASRGEKHPRQTEQLVVPVLMWEEVSPVTVEQATESSRRQTEVRRSQMIV